MEGYSELSYWGEVVPERVGVLLPKVTSMPLTVDHVLSDGTVTRTYSFHLDGSMCMNTKNSDCCLAWFASPVAAVESNNTEAQPAEEEAPVQKKKKPPAKKSKSFQQVEQPTHVAAIDSFTLTPIKCAGGSHYALRRLVSQLIGII